jgi:hypothetical protein
MAERDPYIGSTICGQGWGGRNQPQNGLEAFFPRGDGRSRDCGESKTLDRRAQMNSRAAHETASHGGDITGS